MQALTRPARLLRWGRAGEILPAVARRFFQFETRAPSQGLLDLRGAAPAEGWRATPRRLACEVALAHPHTGCRTWGTWVLPAGLLRRPAPEAPKRTPACVLDQEAGSAKRSRATSTTWPGGTSSRCRWSSSAAPLSRRKLDQPKVVPIRGRDLAPPRVKVRGVLGGRLGGRSCRVQRSSRAPEVELHIRARLEYIC